MISKISWFSLGSTRILSPTIWSAFRKDNKIGCPKKRYKDSVKAYLQNSFALFNNFESTTGDLEG